MTRLGVRMDGVGPPETSLVPLEQVAPCWRTDRSRLEAVLWLLSIMKGLSIVQICVHFFVQQLHQP